MGEILDRFRKIRDEMNAGSLSSDINAADDQNPTSNWAEQIPVPAYDDPREQAIMDSRQRAPTPILDLFYREQAKREIEDFRRRNSEAFGKINLEARNPFMRGLYRGFDTLQGTYQGGLGMLSSLAGDETSAQQRFQAYQDEMRQASENPRDNIDFFSTDAETGAFGSLSNFGTYAAGTLGEAIPSLAESVLTGIAGAALGAAVVPAPDPFDVATVPVGAVGGVLAKGAIKKAISNAAAEYVKRGMAAEAAEGLAKQYVGREVARRVGSAAATTAVTSLHEGGGMYMEGREAGYDSPGTAMGLGLASGLSESLLGAAPSVLKSFAGRSGVDEIARREGWRAAAGYLWDTVKASGEEGVQEGFQEFLGSLNKEINDPNSDLFNKENFMQWAEAAAGGALVGGAVKSGTTGVELVGLRGGRGGRRSADYAADPFLPQLPPGADTSEDLSNVQAEIALLENLASRGSVSRKEAQRLKLIADREETTSEDRLERAKAKLEILKDKEAILLSLPAQDSTAQPPAEQIPPVAPPPPPSDAFEQPTAPEPNAQQQPPVDPFNEEALINDEEVARQAAMEMERMRSEAAQPAVPPSDQLQAPVDQPEAIPPSIDPFQPLSEQELPATSIQPSTDPFDEATAPKSPPTSEIDPFNVPVRQEPSTAQVQQPQSSMLASDLIDSQEPTVDAQTDTTPVPAVRSPEDHAAVPMFGVYETPFRGERKFFVKEFENRGAGDAMFDSLDEANKHSAIVARRNEEKVAREQKAKADEELAVKKQRDHEASFGGFLSADPKTKARQLKVLDSSRTYRGKVVTVKELIEQKVADGAVVNSEGQLESPDGAYLGSDKLTKFGIDYARHLIGSKPSDAVSAESQGEEVSDAQGTRKGGGPNVEVQTEGGQRPSEGQVSSGEEQAAESPSPAFSPTEQYIKLPEKSREKFEAAWKGNDPQAMKTLVHSGNKVLRAEFENRTGEKLPRTVKGTNEVVDRVYAGRQTEPLQSEFDNAAQKALEAILAAEKQPKQKESRKRADPKITPVTDQVEIDFAELKKGLNEAGVSRTLRATDGKEVLLLEEAKRSSLWSIRKLKKGSPDIVVGIRDLRRAKEAAKRIFAGTFDEFEESRFYKTDTKGFVGLSNDQLVGRWPVATQDAFASTLKSTGVYTDGRIMFKASEKDKVSLLNKFGREPEGRVLNVAAILDGSKSVVKDPGKEAIEFAYRGGDIAERQVLLKNKDGGFSLLDKVFHDTMMKKYPDAKIWISSSDGSLTKEPVAYTVGGEIVGVAMGFEVKVDKDPFLTSVLDGKYQFLDGESSNLGQSVKKGRKPSKSQTTLKEAKSDLDAAHEALKRLKAKIDSRPTSGVDPGLMADVVQVAYLYSKAGIKTFKGYVEAVVEKFGDAFARDVAPYMEAGWRALHGKKLVSDPSGKVEDYLTNKSDSKETQDMHYPDGSAYRRWMSRKHRLGDAPTSYLSGHSSEKVRDAAKQNPGLGLVITPANPGYVSHAGDYSHVIIDNGAFSEFTGTAPFSENKFFALLDKVVEAGLKDKVQFVVVPDRVGDWSGTNDRWEEFYERVKAYGMPLAYVGQDGIEQNTDEIPWDQFDVFFIGGSTPWKLGFDPKGEYKDINRPTDNELRKAGMLRSHIALLKEAKQRGKKVHMGRVNSWKRMEMANYGMQVDSADGNYIGAAPDKNLPVVLNWLEKSGGEEFTEKVGVFVYGDAVARSDDPEFVGRYEGEGTSGNVIVRKDGKRTNWPADKTVRSDAVVDDQGRVVTDETSADNYGTPESPNRIALGRHFYFKLKNGESYARITDARKEASDLIGGQPSNASAVKDIDEAVEIGVVLAARDIAQSGDSDDSIYSKLIDLYERQPNLSNRTSTSMAEQAYSTPAPLAFAINRRAGVTPNDTVYDSSAGNGMLLIVGGTRYANELNADRAESLRGQGIETTNEDATSFTLGEPIDALVINPPFGLVNDESGKPKQWVIDGVRTDKVDHAITLQSMKEIPENGKVAIIIGAKGFEKSEPKDNSRRGAAYLAEKRFYDAMYDNYNVVDHFTVHGDLYRRQGASFPVDVIIIDGKGKSQRPKPYNIVGGGIPEVFRTWEDLKDAKLRPVSSVSSTSTGRDEATDSAPMDGGNEAAVEGNAEALSSRPAGTRVGGTDGRKPNPERLGGVDGQSGTANETDAKATVAGGTAGSERGGRDSGRGYAGGSDRSDSRVGLKPDETAETDHQVSYSPGSGNQSVDTLIPRNHQAAVAKSLDAVAEIYGDIDKFVASELGYDMDEFRDVFSAEQVDALALAIARHKDGGAFIIGDQTGVGKGRAAAAMMVYANRNGMVPVFITEKPTLYADMVRDLIDIRQSTEESPFNILMTNSLSGKDVIPLPDGRVLKQSSNAAKENLSKAVASVLNGNMLSVEAKTRKSGKNNAGSEPTVYNAVFTTYSQMQPVRQLTPERAIQLKRISSKSFFVLDESHNAGGTGDSDPDQQGGRSGGQDATITRAEIVRDLIGDAAGVYFSSATYAKRPQTMGLYARTGMTAATNGDPNALAEAIATGGVPLQQVVSEQLVESGMYLRRERSFDGVEFNPKTVDVDLANLDNVASIFSAINFFDNYAQEAIQELSDEITSSGGSIAETEATGQAGLESTSFASILHNLVDQMLLAVKADAVANETIESIKNGEAPVIYVDSTFEAALKRQVEEVGASQGEEIDFSYKDLVRRYLERSREYTTRTDADDPDSVVRIRLTDAQLGPAGVAAYERALAMIDSFKGNMPASPIDWIRKRVTDAGYSISEITGRQVILDYGDDEKVRLGKRPDDEEGAGGRTKTVSRFNNGELDAVLINQSGSTGISMHSSEKFANKKPRHMIIGQPARNIDTFMQSLGRVHRTGQVVLPRFTLLMTNAPAEIRPASVLMKKLSSLNANVTASAKGAVSFDAPDVINVIGDQVVAEYLADNLPLDQALGEIVQLRRDGTPKRNPGIAKKASGRMALRPVAEQKDFWDSVIASYDELIEELNRVGKNPLVASTIDLKAKTIESVTIFDGDEGSSNLFMHPASVETVTANKPGKPMTADEVVAAVSNFYGNPASQSAVDEWVASTREEVAAAYQEYVSMMTKDLSGEDLQHVLMTYQLTGSRQLENLMERIALFAPGNSVSVHERSADGSLLEVIPGYVTKVKRLKGGNPLSASKWVADIAIASPDRIAKAALSRTGEQDPDSAVGRGGTYLEFRSNNELLSDVGLREFEESDLSATEIRYIGVGNILAAYSQLGKAGGQITFFTDSNGEIRRGVLMPRSFRIDRWNEARPVVLDDVDQAHQFLSQGGQLITPDRVLALMMVRGELIARAPKAKSRSGKYTINSTILRAASPHEFGSIGSRMEMAVPDMERQKRVLSAIMSVASLQAVGTDKNLARRVKESTPSKSEQKLGDKLDDLNDTLMQTAPDAINREMLLQATELAIAAEKAGIDVYDRLVAFAVKKLGEQRTREIGAYLYHAGNAAGMKGVRPTRDVLGMPGVTREQAVAFAKAAFPMLPDEQIDAGIDLVERLGMLDKIGFAPFGSPTPGVSDNQGDENNVKGWISFITAARAVVGATKDADVSTFVHEVFHAVRRFTLDRSIPQDKRSGITDAEIMALEKYAGVKYEKDANGNDDLSKPMWDRNAEEKADKAWEQYWFEGKAPNSALESLFEKIARWMRGVYKSINEITGGKLPKEVRDLFDKIVQRGGGVPPGRTTGTAQSADGRGEPLTSIKNAVAEEIAVRRQAIHIWDAATETSDEWLEDADRMLRSDPYIAQRIVREMIDEKPRNLSNTEVAILQLHYRHINNLFENASDRMFSAHDKGDIVEKARLRVEVDALGEILWDIEEAAKAAGREWGRAGVARQIVLRKDFSRAAMLRRARVANGGNPLNEEQTEAIEKLAKQVADLEGKLAKAEQEKTDLERQLRAEKDINEEKNRANGTPRKSESKNKAASKLQDFAKKFANIFGFKQSDPDTLQQTEDERMLEEAGPVLQAYVDAGVFSLGELLANIERDLGSDLPMQARVAFSAAWKNLKDQGDIPTPAIDASNSTSLTRLARRIQRALVEAGITDRDEVVDAVQESLREMDIELDKRGTMDALSGYGQFTPLPDDNISKTIRDINGQLQQIAKLQDMGYELIGDEWVKVRDGVAPSKTGGERRTPTDEERELIRQVNEAKRQGGYKITDPESQLRSAVDAAKRAAANRIYDLQKALREGKPIVGNKTSLAGQDADLDEMRKELAEWTKKYRDMFPKPEATMEQRIAATNRVLDAEIATIRRQLLSGDVMPKGRKDPVSTPEIEAKRARLEALRAQRETLQLLLNPNMKQEQAAKAYMAALLKQIADYQDRLAKNEFDPKPKKSPRILTKDEFLLKKQLEEVKDNFFRKAADYRLANMSPGEKAWDYTKETSHLSRALMTMGDLSAVFRQGGVASFSHPKLAAQVSRDMWDALWSDQAEFDIAERIRNHDLYQFAMTAKLAITEDEARITKQEEAFMGRWVRWGIGKEGSTINKWSKKALSPVRASGRAYTTFLNGMRFELFKLMVDSVGGMGQVTADEAKIIAQYVNVATGRADLGKFNQAAANMSVIFFAPRYVASRFQYFAMPFYILPSSKISGRVKKAIAMEYARYISSVSLFLGSVVVFGSILAGDDDDEAPKVELDPRSTDFLKIRIGETRIDPMAGFSQIATFTTQVLSGQRKKQDGEVRDLRGENHKWGDKDTWDVVSDFVRKKLAPVPGAFVNLITGENVIGEKQTPLSVGTGLFVPLAWGEVKEAMQARGIPAGTAISMLALLGMGGGTYGPKTQYANGNEEQRKKQLEKDIREMDFDSPDPAYSEFLTEKQIAQVKARREERKQDLAYAASASPNRKDYQSDANYQKAIADRDKAMEKIRASGIGPNELRSLLLAYWKRTNNSPYELRGGVFQLKKPVQDRIRQIRRQFSNN